MHFILFFLLILTPRFSFAWNSGDFKAEFSSPWTTKAKNVLIIGSAVTLASLLVEDATDRSQDEVVEDKPIGDLSKYGDWAGQMVPNIAYIIGASATGDNEHALGMFKATAYATG